MEAITTRMEQNAHAIEQFVALQNNQLDEMKEHTKELRTQTGMMQDWVAARKRGE